MNENNLWTVTDQINRGWNPVKKASSSRDSLSKLDKKLLRRGTDKQEWWWDAVEVRKKYVKKSGVKEKYEKMRHYV